MTLKKIVSAAIRVSIIIVLAWVIALSYSEPLIDRPLGYLDIFTACITIAAIVLPAGWIWE